MDLAQYEGIIRSYARRFQNEDDGVEDLEQLGRIAAWKELSEYPDAPPSHVYTSIQDAMMNRNRALRRQKRRPRGGLTSFNAAFSDDDDRTLEDIVGEDDPGFVLQTELLDALLQGLKAKYGYYYIVGMKAKERQPRDIVRNIVRSLIEDIAEIPKKDIPKKVTFKLFKDAGLEKMLWVYYGNSPFHAVMDAYEGEFVPWEFAKKPQGFWKGKKGFVHVQDAIRWFCKKYDIVSIEDCYKVTGTDFEKNGLSLVLNILFHGSPHLALQIQFPELPAWKMGYTPRGYFEDVSHQRRAVTSFLLQHGIPQLEELSPEETYDTGLRLVVSKQALCDYGLRALLVPYKGSPYRLFRTLFPQQILPWTLIGKEQWREKPKDTARDALRWLFGDYLQIPLSQIGAYASLEFFRDVGFGGILTNRNIGFNSSPFAALDHAYPGVFEREHFLPGREVQYLPEKGFRKTWK